MAKIAAELEQALARRARLGSAGEACARPFEKRHSQVSIGMVVAWEELAVALSALALEARLSVYHFLSTFERVTGVTPHQYVPRARSREAALRLAAASAKVPDIALRGSE